MTAVDKYPGYSARHLLGERTYRILNGLRSGQYSTFAEVMRSFREPRKSVLRTIFRLLRSLSIGCGLSGYHQRDWLVKLFLSGALSF